MIRLRTGSYDDTRWLFVSISLATVALSTWLASELALDRKNFEVVTDPEAERLSKTDAFPTYSRIIDETNFRN